MPKRVPFTPLPQPPKISMNCHCGKPLIFHGLTGSTMVGYSSPLGHNHDDNCCTRVYVCEDDHRTRIRRINTCEAAGCSWRGKKVCFCDSPSTVVVDEWPDGEGAKTWQEAKERGVW